MVLQQKLLEKAYFIFKLTGRAMVEQWSGRPVLSNGKRPLSQKRTSGMVTKDAAVSYWPIFSLSPGTVPEVFVNVDSAQSPSRFWSGQKKTHLNTTVLLGVAFMKLKISNTTAPKRKGMRFLQSRSHVPCLAEPYGTLVSGDGMQRQLT